MSTIQDVANLAGVSLMTVSRVINGSDKVSEKTKDKVDRAIEQLDYHPNIMAQGLASGQSHTLAFVFPDVADPYFGDVFKGVEKALIGTDYSVVYFSANTDSALDKVINTIIQRRIDGVAIYDLDPTDKQLNLLADSKVSCILIENEARKTSDAYSTIDIDYQAEAKHIGEIFKSQGYEQVAIVHGRTTALKKSDAGLSRRQKQRRIWKERHSGFMSAFSDSDIKVFDYEIDTADRVDNYLVGEKVAVSLKEHLDKPLAVYCAADVIALGVRGYMLEQGIKIPEEIAIFGTDGLDMATMLYPRLSTSVHPRTMIGEMAATQLIATTKKTAEHSHITLVMDEFFCGDTTKKFN